MEPNKDRGDSRVERLQQDLYTKKDSITSPERSVLRPKSHEVPDAWQSPEEPQEIPMPKKRMSSATKLLIVALIFFIGSAGVAGFTFFKNLTAVSGNEVDISIVGPVSIGGGEELAFDIIIENNNTVQLDLADLVILFPEGTKDPDDINADLTRKQIILDPIEPFTVVKENVKAVLFGQEGDMSDIQVELTYKVPDSTATFEKKKVFSISLSNSPLRLAVEGVREITPNQDLVFNVSVTSNTNIPLNNVLVDVEYPFGFKLIDSSLETISGNSLWSLGTIQPEETKRFTITGSLQGQDAEERVFRFNTGLAKDSNPNELASIFSKTIREITISRPFFDVLLSLDGDTSDEVVSYGQHTVTTDVRFRNTLPDPIQEPQIIVRLTGDVLDETTVEVDGGFYRSSTNTIVWNSNTEDEFNVIQPGESGSFRFSFRTLPLASSERIFKNPKIVFDSIATGRRITENEVPEEIRSESTQTVVFESDVTFKAANQYEGTIFSNTGPIPPRVETNTTYTLSTTVTNSSNRLSNGRVTATLPEYVSWNNKSDITKGTIAYDPVTRRITWEIGGIEEHAGFITLPETMKVQLTLFPSISQLGDEPVLLKDIVFTAKDDFTGSTIRKTIDQINNRLTGQSLLDSRVVE